MIGIYAIAWAGMVVLAIANGALRERGYGRHMPELRAHQLSTLTAGVLFFGYTGFLGLAWPLASTGQAFVIGGIWLVLTVVFEFSFGRWVMKHTWSRLLMDYNLLKGRVWPLLLVWLFLLPYVVMVFFGVGCLENDEYQTSRGWRVATIEILFDPEPLVIHVSKDPVVYMSHIPKEQEQSGFDSESGDVVKVSVLDDVFPRLVRHKAKQEALRKPVSILLTGDDHADCGSVIRVIEDAKRAGIEWIFFEMFYRTTGMLGFSEGGFRTEVGGSVALRYFDFTKETKIDSRNSVEPISITLRLDEVILWGGMPVSLKVFVGKLEDLRRRVEWSEDLRITVHADAKAGFAHLRYILDQLTRAGIRKVMLKPL